MHSVLRHSIGADSLSNGLGKRRKTLLPWQANKKNIRVQPRFFVFCDRDTGVARFRVPADRRGKFPEEEAASLLAMHCLVRGRTPEDYMLLVEAGGGFLDAVASRALRLLEQGRATLSPIRLTRREQEVFAGVVRNLANKEIAAQLHLSERTVKFHVSALLSKFSVRDRVSLMLEASNLILPNASPQLPLRHSDVEMEARITPRQSASAQIPNAAPRARVLSLPRRHVSA